MTGRQHLRQHLGIDLGGTNIKTTILDADYGIVGEATRPTQAHGGPEHVIATMIAAGRVAVETWGAVATCGVGVPGWFDSIDGTIEHFANIEGDWMGRPVRAPIEAALGVPVAIINDARAFTLAEFTVGAARGASTVVCYTLGTGIGGGLVIDGRLRFGRHGRAGELGHLVTFPGGGLCGCGNRGCIETLVNAESLARMAGTASASDAVDAARSGDALALTALDTVTDLLGMAFANMITVLMPEKIVVGGGIAEAGPLLFDRLRDATRRHLRLVPDDWWEIVPASVGPYTGAVGAAIWGAAPQQVPV